MGSDETKSEEEESQRVEMYEEHGWTLVRK